MANERTGTKLILVKDEWFLIILGSASISSVILILCLCCCVLCRLRRRKKTPSTSPNLIANNSPETGKKQSNEDIRDTVDTNPNNEEILIISPKVQRSNEGQDNKDSKKPDKSKAEKSSKAAPKPSAGLIKNKPIIKVEEAKKTQVNLNQETARVGRKRKADQNADEIRQRQDKGRKRRHRRSKESQNESDIGLVNTSPQSVTPDMLVVKMLRTEMNKTRALPGFKGASEVLVTPDKLKVQVKKRGRPRKQKQEANVVPSAPKKLEKPNKIIEKLPKQTVFKKMAALSETSLVVPGFLKKKPVKETNNSFLLAKSSPLPTIPLSLFPTKGSKEEIVKEIKSADKTEIPTGSGRWDINPADRPLLSSQPESKEEVQALFSVNSQISDKELSKEKLVIPNRPSSKEDLEVTGLAAKKSSSDLKLELVPKAKSKSDTSLNKVPSLTVSSKSSQTKLEVPDNVVRKVKSVEKTENLGKTQSNEKLDKPENPKKSKESIKSQENAENTEQPKVLKSLLKLGSSKSGEKGRRIRFAKDTKQESND